MPAAVKEQRSFSNRWFPRSQSVLRIAPAGGWTTMNVAAALLLARLPPAASSRTPANTGCLRAGAALCRIQTARMGGLGTPHSRGIDAVGSADGLSLAQHPCSWPSEPRAPRMAASARGGCPARPSPLSPAPVALTPLAAWLAVGQGHGQRGWPSPPALAGLTAPSPVGTADGPAASNRGGQQVGAPSALRMATPPRKSLQHGPASHRQRGWH